MNNRAVSDKNAFIESLEELNKGLESGVVVADQNRENSTGDFDLSDPVVEYLPDTQVNRSDLIKDQVQIPKKL